MKINPKTLLGAFFYSPLKHVYMLITSAEYRQSCWYYSKYVRSERFTDTSVKLGNICLTVPDIASFVSQYDEIYHHQIYDLPCKPTKILDLGANIGISVLWLKERFPECEIVAVEADPEIYKYLKANTKKCRGVSLRNVAVWYEEGMLSFQSEGADGGRLNKANSAGNLVPSVDVRKILSEDGPFDFIKIDIEGAESRVLPACRGYLEKTKFIFCEYHSTCGEDQGLADILHLLSDEGFRVDIQPVSINKQPFLKRSINAGFDMQLNIFAWR